MHFVHCDDATAEPSRRFSNSRDHDHGGVWVAALAVPTRAADDALDAAMYLLQKATAVNRSGTHHRLLKALRHLQDPTLAPLFTDLSQRDRPSLRVHGVLGLAELSANHQLDLQHLMEIDPPALQAELISSALDAELMSLDDCERVLQWKGIDRGVKLVLATRLVEAGRFEDVALLREAMRDDMPVRRAMAAALLVQMGDPAGRAVLGSCRRRTCRSGT